MKFVDLVISQVRRMMRGESQEGFPDIYTGFLKSRQSNLTLYIFKPTTKR